MTTWANRWRRIRQDSDKQSRHGKGVINPKRRMFRVDWYFSTNRGRLFDEPHSLSRWRSAWISKLPTLTLRHLYPHLSLPKYRHQHYVILIFDTSPQLRRVGWLSLIDQTRVKNFESSFCSKYTSSYSFTLALTAPRSRVEARPIVSHMWLKWGRHEQYCRLCICLYAQYVFRLILSEIDRLLQKDNKGVKWDILLVQDFGRTSAFAGSLSCVVGAPSLDEILTESAYCEDKCQCSWSCLLWLLPVPIRSK